MPKAEKAETAEAEPQRKPLIMTAKERLAKPARCNIVITGRSGVGKTTLARTLDAGSTLFVDLEAGTKALADWGGDVLSVRTVSDSMNVHPWELCRALACIMCGPDPAADPNDNANPYSRINYNNYCAALGGPEAFEKYSTVFWDSATVAARYSFAWSQTQPEAFSERTGKPDNRGAYGLHGRELVRWLTTIQHIQDKSTIVAAILNEETDELRNTTYSLQIDGGKAKAELPGIFDNIATLTILKDEAGNDQRVLICTGINPWGYLAKDRSGALDTVEPPDLAHIISKSSAGNRREPLVRSVPDTFKPAAPAAFNPNVRG